MASTAVKVFMLGAFCALVVSCNHQTSTPPPEERATAFASTEQKVQPLKRSGSKAQAPYRDSAGWTVFTPAADSRIVYVSSSEGDDHSAKVYHAADPALGQDPRTPSDSIKPFKTFAAAFKKTRDGKPDWILLRRGDTFLGSLAVRNGQAADAPFLLASYGTAENPPRVKSGAERALEICCKSFNDIAVQGIEFYAHTRNFDDPEFKSSEGGSGLFAYVERGQYGRGLLIEGCQFRFYTGNAVQTDGHLTDIVFRRNLILDNYSTSGHSQGLFARNIRSVLVEENVFDHNGWYKQQTKRVDNREDGQATMFNHNTYFQDTRRVTFRNNIFLRPASIGTKWTANSGKASTREVELIDNLFIDGEIGISMGGNEDGAFRFRDVAIRDNVLLNLGHSQPTNRDFAWYIDVKDWDGGKVTGNLLVHPGSTTSNNIFGLQFTGESRGVHISDNVIYGFGNGQAINVTEKVAMQQVRVEDNTFYLHKTGRNFVRAKGSIDGMLFANNRYMAEAGAASKFSVNGDSLSQKNWRLHSGDRQSHIAAQGHINTANFIERYQLSLGQPASLRRFIDAVRAQSYPHWDSHYEAAKINQWVRNTVRESLPESKAAIPSRAKAGLSGD